MTSKRCFSKIMYEDFRHKIWMLALSILGNMLALPVAYMIGVGFGGNSVTINSAINRMGNIQSFFEQGAIYLGGMIAMAGAVIVGLSSFRYLFRKNMVDTWHSLPIKRSTLFAAGWLNGFLIWFIPFLFSYGIAFLLGIVRLGQLRREALAMADLTPEQLLKVKELGDSGRLCVNALLTVLLLVIVFLLVQNLVLLAVMLSGNVLNAMILGTILGVAVFGMFMLLQLFLSYYMNTYISVSADSIRRAAYFSPLISAGYIVFNCLGNGGTLARSLVINGLIALGLGVAACRVYMARPSELAEQGVKIKPIRWVSQCVVTLAGAFLGWIFFSVISDNFIVGFRENHVWGVFGAILTGVLAYGVMNIVFDMDFKAFLKGKILMVVCVATGLMTCISLAGDWWGYDTYLPEKDQIAELGLYVDGTYTHNYYYDIFSPEHPLQQIHIKDRDKIYAFLETACERERQSGQTTESAYQLLPEYYEDFDYFVQNAVCKVTLKSGRSYYRSYHVSSRDCEAAYALVTTPEYLNANYVIPENLIKQINNVDIWEAWYLYKDSPWTAEEIQALCRAYNKDVLEHTETIIRGNRRSLISMNLRSEGRDRRTITVYENMENTIQALKQCGRGEMLRYPEPAELKEITLRVEVEPEHSRQDLILSAANKYGVSTEALKDMRQKKEQEKLSLTEDVKMTYDYACEAYELHITDQAEIRELLPLLTKGKTSYNVFQKQECYGISLQDKEGRMFDVYIERGALPEKYIYRFAEATKAELYY